MDVDNEQDPLAIPVLSEVLEVGVRAADRGGVRIDKQVATHEQTVETSLRQEQVEVRRVPVGRVVAMADAPAARQEGDTLIVPVLEEVLVVEKRLRIKEEIHITRSAREQPWRETVHLRSEQVTVTPLTPAAPDDATLPNGGTHHATHTVSGV